MTISSKTHKRATVLTTASKVFGLSMIVIPSLAVAQNETTLIQPSIPAGYDRGRNVSVVERPRPEYDALGIRAGGFLVYPRLSVGLGYSSNIYIADASATSDGYFAIAPSVRVTSDWTRNQLSAFAQGNFNRYFNNSRRNETEGGVGVLGRADIGVPFSLTGEAQYQKLQEDPFSGEADATLAALSRYSRAFASARGEYRAGQVRLIAAYDFSGFRFDQIDLGNGVQQSQVARDRDINRVTGQAEYAMSPSLSAYTQVGYADTRYTAPVPVGFANRDSQSYRIIGGVNFDLASFMRGSIGVGYTRRDYKAASFKDVGGVSVEGKLEYFPSELTTVTATARRVLEDSSIGTTSALFDSRVSLRIDHELLRNLLLNVGGEYSRQDYVDTPLKNDVIRATGGGRFLLNRNFQLALEASYAHRKRDGGSIPGSANIATGFVSIIIQR